MGLYNLTRIERWHEDFTDLKNRFNNDYYQDFKSSYLRKCSNQLVSKMYLNLQEKYLKIRELYKKVDTVWSEYIVDLENTDNRLAGQSGSVSASTVSSLLSKMPQLNDTQYSLSNSEGQSKNAVLEIGEKILSTGAVVVTTVYSGLFKLREKFQDGALWLAATVTAPVVSLFNKEAGEKYKEAMMDAIAVDRVAEANKYFYENTKVGKYINEKSYLKYDSEFAKKMQDYSEKGFEIAAATALTVATGGLAAPVSALMVVGTGFAVGAGEKAEENYQQADRSFYGDAGEIAFAGLIKGIEFYGEGKMGQGAINATSAIKSAGGVKSFLGGIKTVLSNGESTLFTKESLKKGLKTIFKDVDTYMDSASAAIDNITYDNKNGIQVNWKELAKETACNFVMNFAFAFVGNAVERKMTSDMKNLELNANSAKSNPNIDSLKKEYDELLKESKEPWFVKAKEASDNGWAWDLNKVNEADSMVKRMNELEIALGIENTGIPEYKIHDYSQAKKEADAMVQEIKNKPIPGFENIDTNSPGYKKAMQEFYSKPSPSGKQDLSQVENPFNKNNVKKIDKSRDLNKIYFDNSQVLSKQGISYEQYAAKNGIKIKYYTGEMDLAVDLGDENWYLVQVLKNNEKSMSPDQLRIAQAACNKPRLDLDADELLNAAGPFLTENDITNLNEIGKHPNMKNLTLQEKHTIFQFQNAGGCEINQMLRGKDYSSSGIESFYDLENIMQAENSAYGAAGIQNHKHLRTIDENNTIVEQIDNIIKNNANTSTIKSVSYLNSVGPNVPTGQVLDTIEQFGPNSPEALQAVQDLIGLDMTDSAFNSKTIPPTRKTNYSNRFNNLKMGEANSLDIKVESYISPGCGAYIDTCGGVNNGLGEMLIKRNCPQKIIDAYIDPATSKLVLVTLYT